MRDGPQMHSPIHRARDLLIGWIEELPEAMRMDATCAVDNLCLVAERQANDAWLDGYRSRRDANRRDEARAQEEPKPEQP